MKNTVIIKPNGKKKQYQSTESLSAVETPTWLLMFAKTFDNATIIDAEAENLSATEVWVRVQTLGATEVHILPVGSHPSAHIQQLDEAKVIARYLGTSSGVVKIHEFLPFDPCSLGVPNWNLLNFSKYRAHNWHSWGRDSRTPYASVFSSVSCPYNCDFCCVKSFYRQNYKLRPISDLIADLNLLYCKYKVSNIKMMDELFVTKGNRMTQIADALQDIGKYLNIWSYARIDTVDEKTLKDLKRMGVRWLAYGIESGSDEIRQKAMKGSFTKDKVRDVVKMTRDLGLHVVGNYMFGFEDDSLETMHETLDFAKELNCEYANLYCTVAYPGSKLYENIVQSGKTGILPTNSDGYAQMSKDFKPLPTKYLSSNDVIRFRDRAFKIYHEDSRYLNMIKKTFGPMAVKDIREMNTVKIKRNYE